jgi:hypothetical protein
MARTLRAEKLLASCRRAISSSRGWRQFPGLSVLGRAPGSRIGVPVVEGGVLAVREVEGEGREDCVSAEGRETVVSEEDILGVGDVGLSTTQPKRE